MTPEEIEKSYQRMFLDPHIDEVIKRIKDGTLTKAWTWEDDPDKVYIEAMERKKLKENENERRNSGL